jgi:hypothetical protein
MCNKCHNPLCYGSCILTPCAQFPVAPQIGPQGPGGPTGYTGYTGYTGVTGPIAPDPYLVYTIKATEDSGINGGAPVNDGGLELANTTGATMNWVYIVAGHYQLQFSANIFPDANKVWFSLHDPVFGAPLATTIKTKMVWSSISTIDVQVAFGANLVDNHFTNVSMEIKIYP